MEFLYPQERATDERPERKGKWSDHIRNDRRRINALLQDASRTGVLDSEVYETDHLKYLGVNHANKRGKGPVYDRARSSEWKRSKRTDLRRKCKEGTAMVCEGKRPQAKQHTLQHKAAINDIFARRVLPADRSTIQKDLEKRKEALKKHAEHQIGSEKHATMLEIKLVEERLEDLWNGLEPYQRNAYWIYVNARKRFAKLRKKIHRAAKNYGRHDKATRKMSLADSERQLWKAAKENLHRHNLAKGYEVKS